MPAPPKPVRPPDIRQLTQDDVAIFRQLMECFAASFEDDETYLRCPPASDYLVDLLAQDYFITVVASDADGTVIGGLTAYELKKFEQARSEIYIYDLAVAEDHRRRGTATALIDRLKQIASDRGAYIIFVQADITDPPAIALYSKLGRCEDVLHFDIEPS